jgi:hypothetical protein
MRMRAKRIVERIPVSLKRSSRINITRTAVLLDDSVNGHIFDKKLIIAVGKMIHE